MMDKTKIVVLAILLTSVITLAFIIALILQDERPDHPSVRTECGLVEGRTVQVVADNGRTVDVNEFLNIPYALPPTGHLRWRAPVSLKEGNACWNDELKHDKKLIRCVQKSNDGKNTILGDEDCLILNIWSPVKRKKKILPVLVWIHSGAMVFGHSRTPGVYPDSQFAASLDVLTVSINYRLNIFGFLSLKELWSDTTAGGGYGNYAIMDQILALRWIKSNIMNFGGDPDDVTIFGESGGGTATYSLLSASLGVAKGLFRKMIASSGAPNIRTKHKEADIIYRPLIRHTNCARSKPADVALCLRNLDVRSIMKKSPITVIPLRDYEWRFPYNVRRSGPPLQILDPIVIKYSPSDIPLVLKSIGSDKLKIDILMGNMAQEPLYQLAPKLNWYSWDSLKQYLTRRVDSFKKGLYPSLLALYTQRSPNKFTPSSITPYYVYSLMTGDILVSCTTTKLAYDLSKYNSLKVYSYIVSQPFSPLGSIPLHAEHAYDVTALFGFEGMKSHVPNFVPSADDIKLKMNLRHVIKSFIYSDKQFELRHRNRTMEFWKNKIHTWEKPYHEQECKMLRDNGFLKHSWGNVGVYD